MDAEMGAADFRPADTPCVFRRATTPKITHIACQALVEHGRDEAAVDDAVVSAERAAEVDNHWDGC